jgi:hypothetical protein
VLPIEVPFQTPVVLKVLVLKTSLVAHVTLKVIARQVCVKLRVIVESRGSAEFAEGVTLLSHDIPACLEVLLELRKIEARQPRHKVPLVVDAKSAKGHPVLQSQVIL